MAQILIADTPEAVVSLERILAGHKLVISHTLAGALANLTSQSFDLIIIGVHFDQSQMFELMHHVRADSTNASKPIICFAARDTEMTRIIHEAIEIASKAAGAWMYLDAHSYNVYKDPEEELRRVIERCFTDEARKEIQRKRISIQKQRAELQQLRLILKEKEWSPELEEYLAGLRHDLEVLLQDVQNLQNSATVYRANVAVSRQLKDRVSLEVSMNEDRMERAERIQHLDETRQSIQEKQIVDEEEARRGKLHRDSNQDKSS